MLIYLFGYLVRYKRNYLRGTLICLMLKSPKMQWLNYSLRFAKVPVSSIRVKLPNCSNCMLASNMHLLYLQVFTDNVKLCMLVTESKVSSIFHHASSGCHHAELFTTLQAMTKVRLQYACMHT